MAYERFTNEEETPSDPPPSYTAPPPGFNVPPQPPHGPTVACGCCGFSISTSDVGPNARLVHCPSCQEYTAIGPPPLGKKYLRCVCKKHLVCREGAVKVICPGCKAVVTVTESPSAGGFHTAGGSIQNVGISEGILDRVVCAHCNHRMLCGSSRIVRCGGCKRESSVGPSPARLRCVSFLILGVLLLGTGIAITAATYVSASRHGGYYYIHLGLYIFGLSCLGVGIRYGCMGVSYPENHTPTLAA